MFEESLAKLGTRFGHGTAVRDGRQTRAVGRWPSRSSCVPEGQSMPPLSGLSGLVGDGIAGLPTGGAGRLENSVQSLHDNAGTIGTTLGASFPDSMP